MDAELGPIWRSLRRHRAFALTVFEVALGFFIVSNLILTCRWYSSLGLPPSGHRQDDVVEITSRTPAWAGPPATDQGQGGDAWQRRERRILSTLPHVRAVASVSATQIDDRWALPNVFWPAPGVHPVGPSACAEVSRAADGAVVGWGVEADAGLADTIDLKVIEGQAPDPLSATGTVIITQCLRLALFGARPVVGEMLHSNRHPPARIVGVIDDVRMRVPFLYQTQLTAIFTVPSSDERFRRYLVRTEPGGAPAVRAAAEVALALPASEANPDHQIVARLFDPNLTRCAGIASGIVLVLLVIGASLGLVAVLGNLAVAAFLVGDRRRVVGVRRALGATRWDILRYLLIENLVPTQIGNLLGLAVTLLCLPAAQKLFFGLRLRVVDVAATALLLSLGGVAAKLLPAFRATRIPPSEVSRAL